MVEKDNIEPRWPTRLQQLCQLLQTTGDASEKDEARSEAWLLLNSSIFRYLCHQAPRMGSLDRADLEDIAAQKSLDLLQKSEQAEWDLAGRSPAEIAGFLATVARNGLLDMLRRTTRQIQPDPDENPDWMNRNQSGFKANGGANQPSLRLERREFVEALRDCAADLQPRSRMIWFFRVFLEMASKEISTHPEVGIKSSHVDVILQRARESIRECMEQKGFQPHDMPPGTFIELWRVFRDEGSVVSKP